jgi:hypothetical protein
LGGIGRQGTSDRCLHMLEPTTGQPRTPQLSAVHGRRVIPLEDARLVR